MVFAYILHGFHLIPLSFLFNYESTLITLIFLFTLTFNLPLSQKQMGVAPLIHLRLQCHPRKKTQAKPMQIVWEDLKMLCAWLTSHKALIYSCINIMMHLLSHQLNDAFSCHSTWSKRFLNQNQESHAQIGHCCALYWLVVAPCKVVMVVSNMRK